jgi:hypothetical protein
LQFEVFSHFCNPFVFCSNCSGYNQEADQWCDDNGATTLDEIRENWEDFGKDLGLTKIPMERLGKDSTPAEKTKIPGLSEWLDRLNLRYRTIFYVIHLISKCVCNLK